MDKNIVTTESTSKNEGSFDMDTSRARIVVVRDACGSGKRYACRALLKTLFQQGILKWMRIYSHAAAANHEYDWTPQGCVHPIDLDAALSYH